MDTLAKEKMDTMRGTAKIEHAVTSEVILKYTFGLVPIVAGLDKFFYLLTDWEKYLHPAIASIIPASTFMIIVGIIEIVAGIIVFTKTRLGAYIVSLWLLAIALNLIFTGFYDIAVRDIVMAISAFVLGRLSEDK